MKLIKYLFSNPYLIFGLCLLTVLIYDYVTDGSKVIAVIIFHLLYFPVIVFIFSIISTRLTNLFTGINITYQTLRGYMFLLTYAFPWFAVIAAIVSKLFKINEEKKFVYVDKYGNTITNIHSNNPTLVYKKDKGDEEEIIVVTKYKRKKGA